MKKLIVHIGTAKAGSSTIQRFLKVNQKSLADNCGIWIADHNMNFKLEVERFPIAYFQNLLEKVESKKRPHYLAETWKKLAIKMERAGQKIALISAESISNSPDCTDFFESATLHFKIHVIAYFRIQDEWIASAWKQWGLKAGMSLEDCIQYCINTKSPRFLEVFKSWERITQSENIYIRPLAKKSLHPDGLARDFAEAVGIKHDNLNYDMPIVNSTFDHSILSILSSKPSIFKSGHDSDIFNYLDKFPELTKNLDKSVLLSSSIKRYILDSFAEENREMHRKFFPHLPYDELFGIRTDTEQEAPDLLRALTVVTAVQFKMLQVLDHEVESLKRRNSPTAWLMSMRDVLRRWKRSVQKRIC